MALLHFDHHRSHPVDMPIWPAISGAAVLLVLLGIVMLFNMS